MWKGKERGSSDNVQIHSCSFSIPTNTPPSSALSSQPQVAVIRYDVHVQALLLGTPSLQFILRDFVSNIEHFLQAGTDGILEARPANTKEQSKEDGEQTRTL